MTKRARRSAILPGLAADRDGWISRVVFASSRPAPPSFPSDLPTHEIHAAGNARYYGPFRGIRSGLDRAYHGNYSRARQRFQDEIVEKLLDGTIIRDSDDGRVCRAPTEPWIVFTAGIMGAGKSYAMTQLASKGLFPLRSYVVVDPDEIRSHFPEYRAYATRSPKRAGELTHREAGYVAEIATAAALRGGFNVLVDGSLRDAEWYRGYFVRLRGEYGKLRVAILHITAPRDVAFERAANRAKDTGRVVPLETLEMSLRQVPISVEKLAPMADFFCELDNSPSSVEVSLKTEGVTWDSFRDNWAQTCPWIPPSK